MKKIFIAGGEGMVGRATSKMFPEDTIYSGGREWLDLQDGGAVSSAFDELRPDIVICCAAKVGGILANKTYPGQFIHSNLQIQSNLIEASRKSGVKKLIFLGSSCIYPRLCPQPMREEHFLSGPLEPTNEAYAIAKIAGIKMCESYYREYGCNFYSLMPTNLYGPWDNYHLTNCHVLPAMIEKFHHAKGQVVLWGDGLPKREFMHVSDMAESIRFCVDKVEAKDVYGQGVSHLNVGTGKDVSIIELASMVSKATGFKGEVFFEGGLNGMPRKLLDVGRINAMGWKAKVGLEEGIEKTYRDYLDGKRKYC